MKKKASTPLSAVDSDLASPISTFASSTPRSASACARSDSGVAYEGAYVRTAGQERVDDRSALLASAAEDGDRAE
ncbi:hypothetical protein QF035_000384 [Streptomyces umbrinus]|uniref:Uncharacterized protein n=1 Tax=Streptomyces umbrinus TaxID=67370 RepID=A0ABU0SGW7_9ACTN|nr:hypothetical protein [Streptomyces umbrinus]